jgi:hypothetical protein
MPIIRIVEAEGTSVISEVHCSNPHLTYMDIPYSETIAMASEYESSPRPSSTGGSISAPIEDILEYLRVLKIKISSPSKVKQYLYNYSELIELLEYVAGAARDHFGSSSQLFLDIYQDQEAQYERLTLYIRQYIYEENIMTLIKKIRKDYHLRFPEIRGRFLLTTDFHIPR